MQIFKETFERSRKLTESDRKYTLGSSRPGAAGKIVAVNDQEGWYISKMTIEQAAKEYGSTVENFISECGYDYSTPVAMYVGVDIALEQESGIGEGESAVIGIEWEDGTYAHYGVQDDSDKCDKTEMFEAIVMSGLMKNYGTPVVK